MNIFVLDKDPITAATYLNDKHVVKMALESAQILSVAHRIYNNNINVYNVTHLNHPCVQWTLLSVSNYRWLYNHFISICDQYTKRYLKTHKSYIDLNHILVNPPVSMSDSGLTEFVQAMPDMYKRNDVVQAYRNYYIGEKLRFSKWSYPSTIPYWVNDYLKLQCFNNNITIV